MIKFFRWTAILAGPLLFAAAAFYGLSPLYILWSVQHDRQQAMQQAMLTAQYRTVYADRAKTTLHPELRIATSSKHPARASIEVGWRGLVADGIESSANDVRISSLHYAENECRFLLERLASTCRIVKTDMDAASDRIRLTITLEFMPAHLPRQGFLSRKTLDALVVEYRVITSGDMGTARQALYGQIAEDCLTRTKPDQPCLIGNIHAKTLASGDVGSQSRTLTEGSAEFAVPRPSTPMLEG